MSRISSSIQARFFSVGDNGDGLRGWTLAGTDHGVQSGLITRTPDMLDVE